MYIILLVIILVCAFVITFIVVRKFPQLTMVKADSSSQERQQELKKNILEKRLKRQIGSASGVVWDFLKPVFDSIKSFVANIYQGLRNKEEEYRHKLLHQDFQSSVDKEQLVSELMTAANEAEQANDYDTAEDKFIQILKIDPQNVDVYLRLGKLYWEKKEYQHAIEVYNYLLKLSKDYQIYENLAQIAEERGDLKEAEKQYIESLKVSQQGAEAYYNLAKLYKQQEKMDQALETAKKAVHESQHNPKYLDLLVQMSIIVQDKKLAQESLDKLEQANPENHKLSDYRQQISDL